MLYALLQYTDGTQLLQENYLNVVQRYCDFDGNTTNPPPYGYIVLDANYTPAFTPTPDPYTPSANTPPQPDLVTRPIIGTPLKTFSYDDKGQMVRIDYPNGRYHLIEYISGRVSKVSELNELGLVNERYHYYDEFGRPLQIDKP